MAWGVHGYGGGMVHQLILVLTKKKCEAQPLGFPMCVRHNNWRSWKIKAGPHMSGATHGLVTDLCTWVNTQ